MAEGEFARVRQHMEIALEDRADWVGNQDVYAMLVEAAVGEEDGQALEKYTPLLEKEANRHQHALYQGIAQRGRGVAHRLQGEYDTAQQRLAEAQETFQKLGTRWQSGRTLLAQAELAVARADKPAAVELFSEALAIFEALGAEPDAGRTRQRLASLQ